MLLVCISTYPILRKNEKSSEKSKLKPFIDNYNLGGGISPASTHDFNKFERNYTSIALVMLYVDVSFNLIKINCGE